MMRTLNATISDRELSDYRHKYRHDPDVLRLLECIEADRIELQEAIDAKHEADDRFADNEEVADETAELRDAMRRAVRHIENDNYGMALDALRDQV